MIATTAGVLPPRRVTDTKETPEWNASWCFDQGGAEYGRYHDSLVPLPVGTTFRVAPHVGSLGT